MDNILSTYEIHKDDTYEALNKNPDAVYYFKDGILFLLLHSEFVERSRYGYHKIKYIEYFNEWYDITSRFCDFICTSSIIHQFGGVHKYNMHDFDTLQEMEISLKEKYLTHNITISYFDCIVHNDLPDIKQYRIVANFLETKQKTRKIKLEDLLS